jgi:hypothetical protein
LHTTSIDTNDKHQENTTGIEEAAAAARKRRFVAGLEFLRRRTCAVLKAGRTWGTLWSKASDGNEAEAHLKEILEPVLMCTTPKH